MNCTDSIYGTRKYGRWLRLVAIITNRQMTHLFYMPINVAK